MVKVIWRGYARTEGVKRVVWRGIGEEGVFMLKIKGETRGEYFHILCEECGNNTYNEYLGFETEKGYSDGVPHLKATCKVCKSSWVFKLMPMDWKDIKERIKKRKRRTLRMQIKLARALENKSK